MVCKHCGEEYLKGDDHLHDPRMPLLRPVGVTQPRATADQAYKAGHDCGREGANTENCHYKFFAAPELTAAWQHGKSDAEREARGV